jgi:hypothetical protein
LRRPGLAKIREYLTPGNKKAESASLPRQAANRDFAAQQFHDLLADIESKPNALTG